jgi:hypothetical protein
MLDLFSSTTAPNVLAAVIINRTNKIIIFILPYHKYLIDIFSKFKNQETDELLKLYFLIENKIDPSTKPHYEQHLNQSL